MPTAITINSPTTIAAPTHAITGGCFGTDVWLAKTPALVGAIFIVAPLAVGT